MKLKSDYKVRKIAGESVIVRMGQQNVKMTTIISLNPTSEWLWEQLQGVEFDAEKVADLLTGEYEVEREVALKDAEAWIASLTKADLVSE
ncbi:MAG: PqqD family protein [Tidjanibacter sp.]|nr:PqqD family protein [Tidjanibacter sp.]MBQ3070217.1 PqqD family protein [Tidjanibacter sp.]MBR1958678.1 PqqD family protein [Tidjanibacter sp.]MBR2423762.1 PqqD family protein [Tidjanibacter sp.]MBR3931920.1 PqqD family protein [Tidjanibacter sp.]